LPSACPGLGSTGSTLASVAVGGASASTSIVSGSASSPSGSFHPIAYFPVATPLAKIACI